MRLTVKEKVLLHLGEYAKHADAVEVPSSMTQEGICRATGIDLRHFTQYVRPLVKEGLVRERLAHVRTSPQRLKVYELTGSGNLSAIRLRENVKSETVRVRDGTGLQEAKVSEILAKVPGTSIVDIVRQVLETGAVDIAALTAPRGPAFVAMLSDAPAVARFVGRERELEALTGEADRPRIFVVRGVAGIGKSSLGAKACEALSGRCNVFWHRVQPWDTFPSLLAGMGDFLHTLGRPGLRAVLARGEASRAAWVLREDLAGTRSFLVFDDAHQANADARPFFQLLKEAVADASDVRILVLTREAVPFYDRRDVTIRRLVAEMDLAGLGADEISQIVPNVPDAPELVEFGRRIGGHPLFLELLRAYALRPSPALRDVHRFIEEEIYAKLSSAERQMMKTASLYEVPVPREALFSDPTESHDVLLSLADRSLLRIAGTEAFEAHDTIRSFFADVLTPSEREGLGAFAVAQLRQLATGAFEAGDFVTCINYLSNALRLSASAEERAALWERLGDAHRSIGDLDATLADFGEAMETVGEAEGLARLHRKRARALVFWDRLDEASREVAAGLGALGGTVTNERGWLDLTSCEICYLRDEHEEAREHGRAALQVFQALGNPVGQVHALTDLADTEVSAAQGNLRLADRYLTTALGLSDHVKDGNTLKRLYESLAWLFAHGFGDVERAMVYNVAMERIPEVMGDPTMRREVISQRAFLHLDWTANLPAAERAFEEATALARSVHDEGAVILNDFGLATAWFFEGRIDEARAAFQRYVDARIAQGFPGHAVEGIWRVAECCLWQGDLEGFLAAVARLDDPNLSTGVETRASLARSMRGIEYLLRRRPDACEAAFREAIAFVEGQLASQKEVLPGGATSEESESPFMYPRTLFPHVPYAYYGMALRVMGRDHEASEYLTRAAGLLRAKNLNTRLAILPEQERRFVDVLRRASQGSQERGGSG